ncbi:MAG: hypothetical protein AAB425_02395 [Bdellovibrionota bacterium]
MRMALGCGSIGVALVFLITGRYLGFSPMESLSMVLASNLLGFLDLLFSVEGQNVPWIRKYFLVGPKTVWVFFVVFYFGGMALLFPVLRDFRNYLMLALPLVWTPAFAVLSFGPPRDWLVHRRERLQRLKVPPTGGGGL